MHAIDRYGSSFAFANDTDNVVDLSFYRRWRKLRRPVATAIPPPNSPFTYSSETDQAYLERMKVNGAAFAFIALLVLFGIWLVDGLLQVPHHLA